MSVDALLKEVEALSVAERTEFMTRLRERFEDAEISDELKAELDRRVAEAEANPTVGYTLDEVVAYVKRKK
ncbi:MAG: addiction module protein [Planctomycetes bacterium]|nr:addiction module protein [Planctomycetota bacterium]